LILYRAGNVQSSGSVESVAKSLTVPADDLARNVRLLERRVNFETVAQFAEVANHGRDIIANTSDESETGDEDSGHNFPPAAENLANNGFCEAKT